MFNLSSSKFIGNNFSITLWFKSINTSSKLQVLMVDQ